MPCGPGSSSGVSTTEMRACGIASAVSSSVMLGGEPLPRLGPQLGEPGGQLGDVRRQLRFLRGEGGDPLVVVVELAHRSAARRAHSRTAAISSCAPWPPRRRGPRVGVGLAPVARIDGGRRSVDMGGNAVGSVQPDDAAERGPPLLHGGQPGLVGAPATGHRRPAPRPPPTAGRRPRSAVRRRRRSRRRGGGPRRAPAGPGRAGSPRRRPRWPRSGRPAAPRGRWWRRRAARRRWPAAPPRPGARRPRPRPG